MLTQGDIKFKNTEIYFETIIFINNVKNGSGLLKKSYVLKFSFCKSSFLDSYVGQVIIFVSVAVDREVIQMLANVKLNRDTIYIYLHFKGVCGSVMNSSIQYK